MPEDAPISEETIAKRKAGRQYAARKRIRLALGEPRAVEQHLRSMALMRKYNASPEGKAHRRARKAQALRRPGVMVREREWKRRWRNSPEGKAYHNAYYNRLCGDDPWAVAHRLAFWGSKFREYRKRYRSQPDVKARRKAYDKIYRSRPEVQQREREWQRIYLSKPEKRESRRAWDRAHSHSPKSQEQAKIYPQL